MQVRSPVAYVRNVCGVGRLSSRAYKLHYTQEEKAMSYEFRVVPHAQLPGAQVVECWQDGVFVVGVYPHEDGIRIVSKYMLDVSREDGWPPSAIIKLGDIDGS